jgi:hypothetical protein
MHKKYLFIPYKPGSAGVPPAWIMDGCGVDAKSFAGGTPALPVADVFLAQLFYQGAKFGNSRSWVESPLDESDNSLLID